MIDRYALPEISEIWEDENKFSIWLEIELLACEAQAKLGLIPPEAVRIIRQNARFDAKRILEIEETVQHDVIAFLTNVAEYVGPEARFIHYGMTSSDILDTTLAVQMKQAGELILKKLQQMMELLQERAKEHRNTVMVGRTHGVHAEPITLGLKLALWAEDTRLNIERLNASLDTISVGQISGAVGTYDHLDPYVEEYVCKMLELKPAPISTQIIQRDRHADYMNTLALIAAGLEKISIEIRHLQKTEVLEMEEPFGKGQKGSSAMPHKKNPIICERISGMARLVRGFAVTAMENIALWHERDISHSSVERIIIPDGTMTVYYMLHKMIQVLSGMMVNKEKMLRNLNLTNGLIYSQPVLLKLIEKGLSREEAYQLVQKIAMEVWKTGKNFEDLLKKDDEINRILEKSEIELICNLENRLKNVNYIFKKLKLI
ncbi:MAG: adenylosuccinate lyase [Calditrichaeota bacterium]|nr:adenylosuccinate lyase [Calditrichota bacterium]RQW02474.1 MAG: adenylosuccinate lyase [Calditrichota bacterium]